MKNNDSTLKTALIYSLVIISIFCTGSVVGTLTSPVEEQSVEQTTTTTTTTIQTTEAQVTTQTQVSTQSQSVTTTLAAEDSTEDLVEDEQDTSNSDDVQDEQSQESEELSVDEIAQLFNTAANNAKSNATQIVQEYKSVYIDPEQLVMPSAIQSICEAAMTNFVNGESDPVTYTTSEEIIANFPVFDETWGAQVDESYLETASCVDNGDTYTVELIFKDCENPSAGEGPASAFPTLSLEGMANSTSMIQNMLVQYSDCSITAEIDKATGNLLSATYVMPFYLQFDFSMGFSFTVGAGIDYEYYYTISY